MSDDFEDIFKSFGIDNPEKLALGQVADAYFDRLFKMTAIAYYLFNIDEEAGTTQLKRWQPVIESLTDELDKIVLEYTRKNGEI